MPKALLVVDQQNQNDWPDKLDRWAADVTQEGWTPDRYIPPSGASALDTVNEVNRRNPGAVKLFGNVPIPAAGPINPDGHYLRLYPCDLPYAAPGPWNTAGGTFNNPGIYWSVPRRVGRVYFEQLSNIDKKAEYGAYLDRVHAARTGLHLYEKRAYLINHLAYETAAGYPNIGNIGALTQSKLAPVFGAGLFTGLPDHDPDSGTSDHREYWLELEGHSWQVISDFSGGRGYGLYYTGTSQAEELAGPNAVIPNPPSRPDVAFWTVYGSMIGEFAQTDAYVCGLLLGSLGVIHMTDVGFCKSPDFTLMGSLPVPEIVRMWQASPSSLAWTYQGDPTLPVLPTTVNTAAILPGVDTLNSTEFTTLSQQITAMQTNMQGQIDALSAKVNTLQTSAGQTGAPTAAVPPTGTSGTPATGTGAVPALVINCGAADSAYAKSGAVWQNIPTATTPIDLSGVSLPYDASFYRSGRGGPVALLSVPGYAPGSTVPVRLDFSEPHWATAGRRLFDVTLNGVKVLAAFDIFAAAGAMNKAVGKSFSVVVGADGAVNISLAATAGSPDTNSYLCAVGIG